MHSAGKRGARSEIFLARNSGPRRTLLGSRKGGDVSRWARSKIGPAPVEGSMTSKYLICGLAFTAVMIAALPAAKGIGAATKQPPVNHVNRAAKGDRLALPQINAVKKNPVQAPQPAPTEQTDKRRIMDGCESSFSPVTMPSMAHVAGRCVG
jgi:hypothetical protein